MYQAFVPVNLQGVRLHSVSLVCSYVVLALPAFLDKLKDGAPSTVMLVTCLSNDVL